LFVIFYLHALSKTISMKPHGLLTGWTTATPGCHGYCRLSGVAHNVYYWVSGDSLCCVGQYQVTNDPDISSDLGNKAC